MAGAPRTCVYIRPIGSAKIPSMYVFGAKWNEIRVPSANTALPGRASANWNELEERITQVKNPDCIAVRMSRLNTLSVRGKFVFDLVNITVSVTSSPERC
jgi:hypothetical protein